MSRGLLVVLLAVALGATGGVFGALVGSRRTRAQGLDLGGYRVHAILGGGSTSTVYLGRDAAGGSVAVKLLHRLDTETEQQARSRVDSEVAALRSVVSPDLPRVLDVVDAPGGVAVVTEYVDGATLTAVLARNRRLTAQQACAVVEGAFRGLAVLHAAGLVHRDVKPDNIVVAPGGRSRLVDFGLVQPASLTAEGRVAGSPAYMSPEQAAGGPVDVRSDVWSCGAVLFESLHGHRHRGGPPQTEGGPFDDVVARALATDRELRPADAGELLDELSERAGRAFGADWRAGAAAGAVAAAAGARVLRGLHSQAAGPSAGSASSAGGIPLAATAVGVAVGLLVSAAVGVPVLVTGGKTVAAVTTQSANAPPSATPSSSVPAGTSLPSAAALSPTADVPLDLAALMVPRLLPAGSAGGAGVGPLTLAGISKPAAAALFHPDAVRSAGFVVGRDSFATSFRDGSAEIDLVQLGSPAGAQDWLRASAGSATGAAVAGLPGAFAETVGGQQWIVFVRGPVVALVNASGPGAAARLRALAAQQYARLAGVAG